MAASTELGGQGIAVEELVTIVDTRHDDILNVAARRIYKYAWVF